MHGHDIEFYIALKDALLLVDSSISIGDGSSEQSLVW